ncbi:MAG: GNAT family N-acetyltransferase [Candidatus Micrarchaeia archaeon]
MEAVKGNLQEKFEVKFLSSKEERDAVDRIMRENGFKEGVRGDGLFELYGKEKGNIVIVTVDRKSKEVVGGVEVSVDKKEREAYGLKIAVSVDRQGEGVGKLLVENAERSLKALGVEWVKCTPRDEGAYEFLKRMGYRYADEGKIGDKFVEAEMVKKL